MRLRMSTKTKTRLMRALKMTRKKVHGRLNLKKTPST